MAQRGPNNLRTMDEYLFNHLALPQCLPHHEDPKVDQVQTLLIDRLLDSARLMKDIPRNPAADSYEAQPHLKASNAWESIIQCLRASRDVNIHQRVNRTRLLSELSSLTANGILVIHVHSQNAALMIHRLGESSNRVIFEVFEASPRNEDVLAADNALQWDFPGCAIAIPLTTFNDDDFRLSLATFLEQTSLESTKAFAAQAFKAGDEVFEYRDTPNPTIISSMLMAILEENGQRVQMPILRKRVRDDICWFKADKPWRRLPHWLVLRVTIARYLSLALGGELGRFEYKFFLCICFATFLESSELSLAVEQVEFMKAKLCRRLVKLDVDRNRVQDQSILQRVDHLFEQVSPKINTVIQACNRRVRSEWEKFKQISSKTIPRLPKRASPSETTLPLRVSGKILEEMHAMYTRGINGRPPKWTTPRNLDLSSVTNEQFNKYAHPFFDLARQETGLQETNLALFEARPNGLPVNLCHQIRQYINKALPYYDGSHGQMSTLILNVLESWMVLDMTACRKYPLLREYHPVFSPEILDVLHLASYNDMVRLQGIQDYLHGRITGAHNTKMTVFDDPSNACFAVRYYDECPEAVAMHQVHQTIEEHAQEVRESKYQEWKSKSAEFERLTKSVDESTCIYVVNERDPLGRGFHIESRCPRCLMVRRLGHMRMQIYEHPLPSDAVMAKAVVFELMCPRDYSLYRDTTWMLVSRLGSSLAPTAIEPKCLLREYTEISNFTRGSDSSFTLASVTKSFLKTHYAIIRFPVDWEGGRDGVCKTNGLKLAYFDTTSAIWSGRTPIRPTFAHHLRLQLPDKSPFQALLSSKSLWSGANGPTSYEIMASQMSCPLGVNLHEFIAFQTLLSGSTRRWLSILVELASTNLNFSSETTMMLVSHLTLQCGPPSDRDDPFRLIHTVFRDPGFVRKLLQEVDNRLTGLAGNWREVHLMSTIITLALRVYDLATAAGLEPAIILDARKSLIQARGICVGWIRLLRNEGQSSKSQDVSTAQRLQQHALAAALLCRRTFFIHIGKTAALIDPMSLEAYVESSIAVQENMTSDVGSLPRTLRHDLIDGIKVAHQLSPLILESIIHSQEGFRDGLKHFWPDAERIVSATTVLSVDPPGWICCEIAETSDENHQVVHWNSLLGTLLVNGKPVGKLPQDSQNSLSIRELFGDQPLMVYQSSIPRMTYTLAFEPNRVRVHIGYENGQMVIVAKPSKSSPLFRLVPRDHFQRDNTWDLPSPLVDKHIHWLNLSTGDVYIRPVTSPWYLKPGFGTWILNTRNKTCRKMRHGSGYDNVIDPMSPLFQRIGNILSGITFRRHLLVYQRSDMGAGLEVLVQRLQLLFFVNSNQLLYSPQLGLEIDPNQDAGTWYGLQNKLVCRKTDNNSHRTVLVPLGDLTAKRSGCHVEVQIQDSDKYGKFSINDTLGRIECAAEPLLIYTKALLHAYTSYPLPDPLTGRTGTEESLHWLQSGICYPWTAIGTALPPKTLSQIASLTPARVYYPPGLKGMKTDRWSKNLTAHMQHPLYRPLIESILNVSNDLAAFIPENSEGGGDVPDTDVIGDMHLNERALIRRQLYERRVASEYVVPSDRIYMPRDKSSGSNSLYAKVLEAVHLVRTSPEKFDTPTNLSALLSQGNIIGGYGTIYDKVSLSDRMHTDIRENWGSLVEYCRQKRSQRYSLMFLFAALSFRHTVDEGLLKALAAFCIFSELQHLVLPTWPSYFNFRPGSVPHLNDIANLIQPFRAPPPKDDAQDLALFASAKQLRKMKSDREAHEGKSEEDCRYLAKTLLEQWPCREPGIFGLERALLVDIGAALDAIRPEWLRLYQNMELSVHLEGVHDILNRHRSPNKYRVPVSLDNVPEIFLTRVRGGEVPSLDPDLIDKSFPNGREGNLVDVPIDSATDCSIYEWTPLASIPPDVTGTKSGQAGRRTGYSIRQPHGLPNNQKRYADELRQIVGELGNSKSLVRRTYANDLLQSLVAFESLKSPQQLGVSFLFLRSYTVSRSEVIHTFKCLKDSLEKPSVEMSARRIQWLQLGGLWPSVTTIALLELLRSTASTEFGVGMREGLISFGLAITKLQKDMRLNDCVLAGDTSRFQDEEANAGHSNWEPSEHPDWLLLEIESNLLIRPDQVDVARATIWPASGANSVLQMNMGRGKTSCIIPMVALSMANKRNLVRIIVPKALLLQTAQLLQSRLGGLLNRHIRHIPFSRRTVTTKENIKLYYSVHKHMLKTAGVMLCQPEHNLSFLLSGQQRLLDDKATEGAPMVKIQSWLKSVCRDILDESDYTLAVRTQLIYPSGSQALVDGHPHRWQVIETVLSLVDRHLYGLANSFPSSIKIVRREGGGFPIIYFLRPDVEDEMLRRLIVDITNGFGGLLPMNTFGPQERVAVKDFLSPDAVKLRSETVERVRRLCSDRPHVKQIVYLLRGLLVNRILVMTLKKRWNVQYGLHPNRSPVAVPYIAKGVASDQSEWGHPDVAILFTCLAFYYDGVNQSQLKEALSRVLKSDDPSTEYDKWAQSSEFPQSLRAWNTINVDDDVQLFELWSAVRYQVVVIDYYLNNFVFPRHAKQFKVKLQSNGWDIPLFSPGDAYTDEQRGLKPLTTGFSGTNDSRTMLPLTIKQEDLLTLSHTNAEVLTYLLHANSRRCEVMTDSRGGRATERDFLQVLRRENIQILIDAGAQILEMDNETLAKTWLKVDGRCNAALYFDSANKPWVVDKKNRQTPLLASPYADDLSKCLVYLDEAHTRGTDLKFPLDAKGALTLGQGQSKDHTVQAAMRLRQLGTSQSIVFYVPPEVHQVIADLRGKLMTERLDSYDVICWLLDNACNDIEMLQPLYFAQGTDFCRRTQAAIDNPDYATQADQRDKYLASITQNELQTLKELYEPKMKIKSSAFKPTDPKVLAFVEELNRRRKGFQDTGRAVHGSALQEVEQEREIAFEVESVRQVKKPIQYDALSFPGLRPDLETFARTGRLPVDSFAVFHVFHMLSKTALGRKYSISGSINESKLFVSAEFERTAKLHLDLVTRDTFLRPVSWILWSGVVEVAVVLIPEEAEIIMRMIQAKQTHPQFHLITYASPVTRKMLVFNSLSFFSIPALPKGWEAPQWLKTELGILSGRLYFEWDEYDHLCKFLAVDDRAISEEGFLDNDMDGEEIPMFDGAYEKASPSRRVDKNSFSPRPLTFLQEWLAVRRHGQEFAHTPMGFLTQGKSLHASHPFFGRVAREASSSDEAPVARIVGNSDGDVEDQHDGDVFDGVDDMGANVGNVDDLGHEEHEVVYDDDEYVQSSDDYGTPESDGSD